MAKESKEKRKKVKQKDYLGLVASAHASDLWGHNREMLQVNDFSKNDKGKSNQVKVKQKDLMTLIKLRDDEVHKEGKNKSLIKNSKERREVFTDGFQSKNHDHHKRMVFSGSDMTHKQSTGKDDKKGTADPTAIVKRYHSPREISGVRKDSQTYGKKYGHRHRLEEENPVDFGSILLDRIKNWSPHTRSNVKGKMHLIGGRSKSYDLLKGNDSMNQSCLSTPKSNETCAAKDNEIYISLEKKTPREKKDYIDQSKAKLFKDYLESAESSFDENEEGKQEIESKK